MSNTVDKKVVEMQFDNRQFEANVKQSMNTLDKLNNSLKMTESAKGLEEVKKASEKVTFNEMSDSLDTVKAKFSALQIIGITTISRLTNNALDAAKKIKNYTIGAITQGGKARALNIEQAKFQFEGLKMNVKKSMESALKAVQGTAYGLDEAANVASQFGASGIKAGKEMTKSLRGVAGLAAMTSSSYSDIGRIFTQTAGQGRLMGDQLLQISQRGINAAATISKFLNKSEEDANRVRAAMAASNKKEMQAMSKQMKFTEADIRAMVSGGVIDFKTFSNAMDDAFGQHAKDANKTFKGSMANVRAALSRIGADFFTPLLKNKGPIVKILNALIPVIDNIHKALMPLAEDLEKFSKKLSKKTVSSLNNIGKSLEANFVNAASWKKLKKNGLVNKTFINALKSTAKEQGVNVDKMIKKEGSFTKTLKNGWLTLDVLNKTLNKYKQKTKTVTTATTKSLKEFQKVVGDVIKGNYGNGQDRINKLTKAGYDYNTVQKLVNKTLNGYKITLKDIPKSSLKVSNMTKKQRKELKALAKQAKKTGTPLNDLTNDLKRMNNVELIVDSLRNFRKGLVSIIKPIKNAYNEIFPEKNGDLLRDILEKIHELSEKMILSSDTADKVKRSFAGLFAVLDIFKTITNGAFTIALRVIGKLLGVVDLNILDITAAIGDALVKFRDWLYSNKTLKKVIDKLVDTIVNAIEKFKEWFDLLKESPAVKEICKKLFDYLSKKFKKISEYAEKGSDKVTDFFEALSKMNLDDIKKKIDDTFGSITSIFSDKSGDKALDKSLKNKKLKISGFTNFLDDNISDELKQSLRIGGALGLSFGGIKILSDSLKNIKSPITAFTNMLNSASGAMNTWSYSIKENTKQKKYDSLIKIAEAIAIVVASIAVLSLLDGEKVKEAGAIVALVYVLIAGIYALLSKNSSAGAEAKISLGAKQIVAIAASIYLLALALKEVTAVDFSDKNSQRALLVIAGALVLMGVVIASITAISGKFGAAKVSLGMFTIIGMAAALYILAETLKKLDSYEWKNFEKTAGVIAGLFVGLAVLMGVAIFAGKVALGAGVGMLALVGAIGLLVLVVKQIDNLTINNPGKVILGLIIIVAGLSVVLRSMGKAGKNALGAGIAALGIAGAVFILVKTIELIQDISWGNAIKGVIAVSVILTVLRGVLESLRSANQYAIRAGLSMIIIAGVVGLLALVVSYLGNLETKKAIQGTICVGVLLGMIALILRMSEMSKEVKTTLISLALVVGAIAASIYVIGKLKPEQVAAGTLAIGILLGVIAGILFVIQQVKVIPAQGLVSFGILTAIVLAIAAVMMLIVNNMKDVNGCIAIINGISELMLVLSGIMVILTVIGAASTAALSGLASMLTMLAAVTLVIVALAEIQELTNGKFGEFLDTGGEMMKKIGIAIGNFAGGIIAGAADTVFAVLPNVANNLSTFMKNLKPFVKGIKTYFDESTTKSALNLAKVLVCLGGAELITALADMFGAKYSAVKQLSEFADGVIAYGDKVKNLKKGTIKKIRLSAQAALPLAQIANQIPLIGGKLGELVGNRDLGKFGDQLKKFGEGLISYGNKIKDLKKKDIKKIKTSAEAAKPLTEVAQSLPLIGGALSNLMGDRDLGKFGDQLKKFGEGLKEYSKSVKDIKDKDIDQIKKSAEGSKALVDLANDLPSYGGMIDWFVTGTKVDLGSFGNQLTLFGDGLVSYITSISDLTIDQNKLDSAQKVAESLVSIANQIPDDGSFFGFFADDDLADFAEDVEDFGEGLYNYATTLGGLGESDVSNSTSLTNMIKTLLDAAILSQKVDVEAFGTFLTDIADNIPKSIVKLYNGLREAFGDSEEAQKVVDLIKQLVTIDQITMNAQADSLVNFASTLPDVGKYIKNWYQQLDNVSADKAKGVSEAVQSIIDYVSAAVLKMGNAKNKFGDFSIALPKFGKAIKKFYNLIDEVDTETLNSKTGAIKEFSINLAGISFMAIEEFNSNFEIGESKTKTAIETFIGKTKDTVYNGKNGVHSEFYGVGAFGIDGFIDGMRSKESALYNQIVTIFKEVIEQAKKTLDVHSPSKVFEILAKYTLDGYIRGIVKNTNKAVSAVKGSMQKVIKAAKSEMIVGADVAESMAEGILGQFTDQMKNNKLTKKVYKATTAAVSEYAKKLYKKTDDYKTDTQNYKKHTKQLKKAEEDVAKYTKKYNKLSNSNTNALKANEKQIETLEQKREKASKKEKKRIDKELKLLKRRNSELKKGADKETKQAKEIDKKLNDAKNKRDEAKASIKQDGKEITQHIKEALNEIINTVKESVQEYTDPLKQSMETGINLFEKYEKQSKISSNRILKNMRSQIKGFSDYKKNLDTLKEKGFSVGLRKQLAELGIQGANIVEAFAKMDVSQMAEAEKLFNESNVFAEDMRNYNQNLSFDFVTAWKNGIQQLVDEGLDQETAQKLTEMGVEASAPFIQGLLSGDASTRKKNINKLNQDMKTSKKLSDAIAKAVVGSLATAGSKGVKALKNNVNKNNGKKVGTSICQGLVEGVKGNTGTVSGSCYNLGRAAYEALKKSLKVNSPSKETEFIGENYDNGFIGGIIGKIDDVAKAASKMGNTAIDALSETLSTVPDIVENGINTDMVIKPVLDLSDVDEKSQTLNSMFSRDRAMRISSQINGNMNNTAGGSVNAGNTTTVVNNNYTQNISSPKYLSRIDIYRDTLRIVNQHA